MLNKILTTPVDDLVELVKENPNSTVSFLQQKLNLPIEIVERWLVVLEEYRVLKVNYSGFEGYVKYLVSKKDEEFNKRKVEQIDINKLKEKFIEKSQSRNLTDNQMKAVWPGFVLKFENDIRILFFDMANEKGYDKYKIVDAWNKYKEELVKF